MKKTILFALIVLVTQVSLSAQSDKKITIEMRYCIDELSRAWAGQHPDLGARQGAAILPFTENGDRVKKNKLAALVETYLSEQMENSLAFFLVDRDNLDKILKEQQMTLSGLVSDSSAPEIGEISGVNAFISGEILEVGQDFKVSVKLTDVSTAEVIDTYTFNIDGDTMIDASVALQYSYVSANGIGVAFSTRYMITLPEEFNDVDPVTRLVFDLGAKYRISRNFLLEMGIWLPPIMAGGVNMYTSGDVSYSAIQTGLPGTLGSDTTTVGASITNFWLSHVDAQYTINFSPRFNLGIRLGFVSFGGTQLKLASHPYYQTTVWNPVTGNPIQVVDMENRDITLDFDATVGGKLEIAPEFFITPRFALSAVIGYILTADAVCSGSHLSGGDTVDPAEYYDYDPSLMPDGTPWVFNFSGLYGGITLSMFF